MIKLDIIADPICPWCYIGKSYLDRALAAHPDHPFAIEWQPYQLNPEMPAAGMDRRDYLELKFGGREAAVKVYAEIAEKAQDAGLEMDFAAIKTTPNTLNAHRLIHWAGIEGRQAFVVSALFKAYFCEGRDIGADAVLCNIAQECGMDADMIERLLASDADIDDIRRRDAHSREIGVQGVPTFIIGNQKVLTGVQPAQLWGQVIIELNEASTSQTQP
ncbi:MAG: polyketide biosynthesis protein [Rhodobacterales bacterium]|nr:MAG: polyketide biosynthesis protein [Rhodobacterales bacterium]